MIQKPFAQGLFVLFGFVAGCGPTMPPTGGGGQICQAPMVLRHEQPGCGAQAAPRCGSPVGDACLGYRCSCEGKVIIGCDFTSEPFARYLDYSDTLQAGQTCDPRADGAIP
jgi:hypothetical protein